MGFIGHKMAYSPTTKFMMEQIEVNILLVGTILDIVEQTPTLHENPNLKTALETLSLKNSALIAHLRGTLTEELERVADGR
jgi:hypothetical protein